MGQQRWYQRRDREKLNTLEGSFTPFMKRWFCEDPASLKKSVAGELLHVELSKIVEGEFQDQLKSLKAACELAVKRHQV